MQDATYNLNSSKETPDLMRVALLVEYMGSMFSGSQFQTTAPTVQQALQEALDALNLARSAVSFASRTDAGVHARGQVAHFDIHRDGLNNIPNLQLALNAKLTDRGVSVRGVQVDTGLGFNSRRDTEMKWYRYQVLNTQYPSVWAPADSTHVHQPLDVAAMNQALQAILGTHNFNAFKCPDSAVTDDICTIHHAKVRREGELVIFDVVANRFLYKMVRNLMGELLEIGKAQRPVNHLERMIAAQERQIVSYCARPDGLSLMAILHQSKYRFFEQDRYVQTLKSMLDFPHSLSNHTISNHIMESKNNELQNLYRKAS